MKKLLAYLVIMAMTVTLTPAIAFAAAPDAPDGMLVRALNTTSVEITWDKQDGAKKYQVYQNKKGKYVKVKEVRGGKAVIKNLKKNKKYYFKVRAKGGDFSRVMTSVTKGSSKKNVTSVKLNIKTSALAKGDTLGLTATLGPAKLKKISTKIRWISSDKSVATVKDGVVTKVSDGGSCYITALAHNGRTAKCKVGSKSNLSMTDAVDKYINATPEAEDYGYDIAYTLSYDKKYADDITGFRTAGSDAEHAAADFIAGEYEKLGLADIEKVPVTVDKWQYNGSSLTLTYKDGGKDQTLSIEDGKMVSYAAPGTVQLGGDWSDMDIVYMDTGTKEYYDAYYEETGLTDMSGKIVLVAVDQWNEVWIDGPYTEAAVQGAEAIITFQYNGYGAHSDDSINIQDICARDMGIPCLSISPNTADSIMSAIDAADEGTLSASLYVDNEVVDEGGTSYNVIGKIKGSENTGQRILVAAHYDKYFYGFQDDGTAMGMILGIAKAMKDSGFQPANDIIFVAHGTEEWGELGTSTDWAIGSWEMITAGKPEWQKNTLAMINFELPAVDTGTKTAYLRTSNEYGSYCTKFLEETGLLANSTNFYDETIVANDDDVNVTDGISYQQNGVPIIMPRLDFESDWMADYYHTQFDNVDTYSAEVMEDVMNTCGAMAIYIDQMPALELDFASRADQLANAITDNERKYLDPDTIETYMAAVETIREKGAQYTAKAVDINERYQEAWRAGASAEELSLIRAEGTKLNSNTLDMFAEINENILGLPTYDDTDVAHLGYGVNAAFYDAQISALSDGTVTEDDIWIAAEIDGWYEYYAYLFSEETCEISNAVLMNEDLKAAGEDNWGDQLTPSMGTYLTTMKMVDLYYEQEKTDSASYSDVISEYEAARDKLVELYKTKFQSEIDSLNKVISMLQ